MEGFKCEIKSKMTQYLYIYEKACGLIKSIALNMNILLTASIDVSNVANTLCQSLQLICVYTPAIFKFLQVFNYVNQ